MPDKVLLGFDFGMKRIGVALGQPLLGSARPLSTLSARDGIPDWAQLEKLIKEWQPGALIVGLPTMIDGKEQFTTKAAKKFANRLKERFKLPIHLVDERLTTVEAKQRIFDEGGWRKLQSSEIDSVAASLIVEQWMGEQ